MPDEPAPFLLSCTCTVGATAAFSILAFVPENTFRFAIGCCGYPPTNHSGSMEALEARKPLKTPFLMALGREDCIISYDFSAQQLGYFAPGAVTLLKHPGNHHVPLEDASVKQFVSFLLQFGAS